MKHRLWLHSLMVTGLTLLALGRAGAQTINNPNPDCRTGAEGRPSLLGISGGNYNSLSGTSCCTGTLGSLVHDLKGNQFVLSTNTVLARVSPAKGPFKARVGGIIQPGLVDTGCFQDSSNGVAALTRWVPLQFGLNNNNSVDAAIARVKPGTFLSNGYIFNIGPIAATTVPPNVLPIGYYVQKMGRTTCLTEGQIDAIDATGKIGYGNNGCHSIGGGTAQFSHQILVISANGTFAATGGGGSDSGSLVLTEEACPRAIGLVFGATPNGITVINPINKVLTALKVAMVGGCANNDPLPQTTNEPVEAGNEEQAALRTSVEIVRAIKNRHEKDLLKLDEVAGTAIARGENPGQAAMLVLLKKDTPQARAQIPATIEGVPVKIIESGEFSAL